MPEEVAFGRPFLYLCPVLNSVGTFSRCFKENVMEQYVKRTQRNYSLYFRLAVVEQVEKKRNDISSGSGALRYSGVLHRSEVTT